MSKTLNTLAIVMLLITVLGAGAVLYGMNTLVPQVVQTSSVLTPAAQAQETFDLIVQAHENGLFAGKVYGGVAGLEAEECSFVTYTVRLKNAGFFPAEWIALQVQPVSAQEGQDILVLDNGGANVLASGAQGDLSVTLVTTITEPQPPRTIEISCYVFGRKQTIFAQAQ